MPCNVCAWKCKHCCRWAIGGAKWNSAPFSMETSTYTPCVTGGDFASNRGRIIRIFTKPYAVFGYILQLIGSSCWSHIQQVDGAVHRRCGREIWWSLVKPFARNSIQNSRDSDLDGFLRDNCHQEVASNVISGGLYASQVWMSCKIWWL